MLLPGAAYAGPAATGMLSATGRCHTWDTRAHGYVRGESCGVFVMSEQAGESSRRWPIAVHGTAAKHNGQSASFTALNGSSQRALIAAALGDTQLAGLEVELCEAAAPKEARVADE